MYTRCRSTWLLFHAFCSCGDQTKRLAGSCGLLQNSHNLGSVDFLSESVFEEAALLVLGVEWKGRQKTKMLSLELVGETGQQTAMVDRILPGRLVSRRETTTSSSSLATSSMASSVASKALKVG